MKAEYMPAPSRNAVRFAVQTPRIRIIVMSISGSFALTSTTTQAAQTASPAASRPIVRGEPQPQVVVSLIAIRTVEIPIVISAAASQLMRPGTRTGDSGMNRQVQNAGRRRPRPAAARRASSSSGARRSIAPETMPIPAPIPRIAEMKPMLPATRSRGNSSRMIPNASG